MSGFVVKVGGTPLSALPASGDAFVWDPSVAAFVPRSADQAAGVASMRTLGPTATQAAAGLHAGQHVPGGPDVLDYTKVHLAGTHAARLAATNTTVAPGVLWREAETGLIYRCTAATGSISTWALWKGYGQIAKTADQSVTNSATFQSDSDFLFPIEANETWQVHGMLIVTATSIASDFKIGPTLPAGATEESWSATNMLGTATGGTPAAPVTGTPGGGLTFGSNTATYPVEFYMWVFNGSTAGTVQLQWAQNTATASETTTVKAGSFVELRRLA